MLDVVANHVGPIGTDYTKINPFNLAEHYHDYCDITDWSNQWQVENRRFLGLPDLNQENEFVAQTFLTWIREIINKYNIDGIRVGTIMQVPKTFWDLFRKAAGVFQIGEAFNGDVNYIKDYQNYLDSIFNYPLYYSIQSSYCGSFKHLEEYWLNTHNKYPVPQYIANFVENHDNPRFLNKCKDISKFTNAIIFSLLWEGIPVFYYGGEQYYSGGDDPNNREPLWDNYNNSTELYKLIGIINNLRKTQKIWNQGVMQRFADDNFYAFTRGDILACFTNNNNSLERNITYHSFSEGTVLCNALYDGDCVTISEGSINIVMGDYPKVYVKQNKIIQIIHNSDSDNNESKESSNKISSGIIIVIIAGIIIFIIIIVIFIFWIYKLKKNILIIFQTNSQDKVKISIDPDKTIGDLIENYFNKIKRRDLYYIC